MEDKKMREILKENRKRSLARERAFKLKQKRKERRNLVLLLIGTIALIVVLNNILASDMERHIEGVSQECAEKGYGIKAKYTKQGDKYYTCDRGE